MESGIILTGMEFLANEEIIFESMNQSGWDIEGGSHLHWYGPDSFQVKVTLFCYYRALEFFFFNKIALHHKVSAVFMKMAEFVGPPIYLNGTGAYDLANQKIRSDLTQLSNIRSERASKERWRDKDRKEVSKRFKKIRLN